jgi:hypothetical protein
MEARRLRQKGSHRTPKPGIHRRSTRTLLFTPASHTILPVQHFLVTSSEAPPSFIGSTSRNLACRDELQNTNSTYTEVLS